MCSAPEEFGHTGVIQVKYTVESTRNLLRFNASEMEIKLETRTTPAQREQTNGPQHMN